MAERRLVSTLAPISENPVSKCAFQMQVAPLHNGADAGDPRKTCENTPSSNRSVVYGVWTHVAVVVTGRDNRTADDPFQETLEFFINGRAAGNFTNGGAVYKLNPAGHYSLQAPVAVPTLEPIK
jgi:hypothetical protein